ncbi:MAG: DUF6076 domain-containing protein [Acutalibacteraceae bacterium]|nr:DUF6076 domain-containing protein [Acutalibacteraceae bacterium]
MDKISFFSADYRDGRVHIGGKSYPTGTFAVHLLNQFYENDTAARIGVFTTDNWQLENMLRIGYINISDFVKAGERMVNIFTALPWLKPFDILGTNDERNRVSELFSEENGNILSEYFFRRAKVSEMDTVQTIFHQLPKEYDKEFFSKAETLLKEVNTTLCFYDRLSDDIRNAFHKLKDFTNEVDEADRFDEEHLLPIALEVFGSMPFPVTTAYVPIKKTSKSTTATLARRLYFDSYYSFVVTDFFEGLHHGHYPRQCGICNKYFLMTSARRQQYCNGIAPYEVRGRKTTCRKYAASINRKELAAADPVVDIYNRRCSAIRTEKGRGTITETFAAMATELAKEYKFKALQNADYANGQYALDMSREKLYAETDRRLK